MRKRRLTWAAGIAALLSLALPAAMAGHAWAASIPWLGVITQDITSELRDGLDYRGSGVIVNRVVSDSPADRAGIRKGDVIVSVDSRNIDSPAELSEVVRAGRVGQAVGVSLVRNGSRRSVTARLVGREEGVEGDTDEDYFDTPVAPEPPEAPEAPEAPRAPRAPRAPMTPRAYRFDWNGGDFDWTDGSGLTMLRGMGRTRLGVQIQDLNDGLGEALGVPDAKGVLVLDVFKDTPAERAGIKGGDVITRVGDRQVEDVNDLRRALQDKGGRVTVTVMRKGARRTLEAELEGQKIVDRRSIRIPDVRTRVLRDHARDSADRGELEQQMDELRQELRDLRRKLEAKERR